MSKAIPIKQSLQHLRKEYSLSTLNKSTTAADPLDQFQKWFAQAIQAEIDEPNAMILATVSSENKPSARVVLLKDIEKGGLVFYSNFESRKGQQLKSNHAAALVFFWPSLERQVRVEGLISIIDDITASDYFQKRPRESQVSAIISPQSEPIPSRKYLEDVRKYFLSANADKPLERPSNWGGYILIPDRVEFWQGRANRLHDRIQYVLTENGWVKERLAP
ncbi:MAG: pyridoxamine 5'-phosphate oxidase [Bacteroidales bacterium]